MLRWVLDEHLAFPGDLGRSYGHVLSLLHSHQPFRGVDSGTASTELRASIQPSFARLVACSDRMRWIFCMSSSGRSDICAAAFRGCMIWPMRWKRRSRT